LFKKVCKQCVDESIRRNQRISRTRRRALERGALSDAIDPIKVFEKAKWICHLCGEKTIKALRGGYDPLSPELDHIIPLSVGGTHTYGNVACSCRACNGKKGNKIIGQVSLALYA
jgi:5-methylcytosine-specific restriction endonuclease McrA